MTVEYKTRWVGGLHPGTEYHLSDRRRCKSSLVWFTPDIPRSVIMKQLLPELNNLLRLEYERYQLNEKKSVVV